jgi:hypothetical protein
MNPWGGIIKKIFEQFIRQSAEFDTMQVIKNQIDILFEIIIEVLKEDIGTAAQVKRSDTSFVQDACQLR